ncbi:MAG TPA: D-2-hydroxyacid dehydrogenase [Candidatus Saccharimonadaceae bacterium]|jgi:phosphoglycerate dehydrogenase-like enzyme|nr:D-2-hydroxyacid dehydrogenase [Candidatus Saccharimonadaceae bacterium]
MTRSRVLVYVRDPEGVWNLPDGALGALERRHPGVDFVDAEDRAAADAALPAVDAVYGWAVTPKNFASARRLRWIHVSAAGVGTLLFPELVASDVIVTNGRGLHAAAMAEHALGVLLAFARQLHLARDAQRDARWTQRELWTQPPGFRTLSGSTLGVVGFGRVGQAVATLARAVGMRVIAVRRHPAPAPAPAHEQWGEDRLDEMLGMCDAVVLTPALTDATRHLLNAPRLARLRREALVVNLGRGALIDEPALVEALAAKRIAGAALDVFEDEPLPAASPLWKMANVIVTPHVSGLGPHYWERALAQFESHLDAFLGGRPLENVVDKRAGY